MSRSFMKRGMASVRLPVKNSESRSALDSPKYSSSSTRGHLALHEPERVEVRDQVSAVRIHLDQARNGALLRARLVGVCVKLADVIPSPAPGVRR